MKTQQTLFPLLFLVCILLSFSSCSGKKEFTLTGKLQHEGFDGRMVYLSRLNDDLISYSDIDSIAIVGDSFTFTGSVPDSLITYRVFIGKEGYDRIRHSPLIFIPEKGLMHVEIDSDYKGNIHGTPQTDRFNTMVAFCQETDKKLKPLRDSIIEHNLAVDAEISARLQDIYAPAYEFMYNYLRDISGTPLFDEIYLNYSRYLKREQAEELQSQPSERYRRILENSRKEYENSGKSVIGQPYIDLICTDINGKEVRLSDYAGKGKTVFLDFWGSRCPPCFAEIPLLKEIYNKYSSKGLEIISISTDNKKDQWLDALKKQDMPWPQLLTGEGENHAGRVYGINSIPHTVLINAEGIVLKKNLRGEQIRVQLEQLLKE